MDLKRLSKRIEELTEHSGGYFRESVPEEIFEQTLK